MMPMVYVTLSNGMVAVADNHNTACRQVQDIIGAEATRVVTEAAENGEARRQISVRVCFVEVNR